MQVWEAEASDSQAAVRRREPYTDVSVSVAGSGEAEELQVQQQAPEPCKPVHLPWRCQSTGETPLLYMCTCSDDVSPACRPHASVEAEASSEINRHDVNLSQDRGFMFDYLNGLWMWLELICPL